MDHQRRLAHKRLGCACICVVTHAELVYDMSTKALMRCFKRFTARRGVPKKMISDTGTTFKGASRTQEKMSQLVEVKEYFGEIGTQLIFNTERAVGRTVQANGPICEEMLTQSNRQVETDAGGTRPKFNQQTTFLCRGL